MSTNKTVLGLNNWTENEKPLRTEFNSDNQIVDQKLRELTAKAIMVNWVKRST